jgi:O-antigen ligase
MLADYPLGIGPGNFTQFVGRYDPNLAGRDAHNTYVRCATELGIPGILLFLCMIGNALVVLKRSMRKAYTLPPVCQRQILMPIFGFAVGLCMMLGAGLTVSLIYMEALWWILLIPVCLERTVDNMIADDALIIETHPMDDAISVAGSSSDPGLASTT